MAIAFGNITTSNANPNGATQTLAHTQNTGSDRTLLVCITMSNSVNFSGATYAGIAMTLISNNNVAGSSQRVAAYYLQAPATGSNNIVISFSGSQFNSTSIMAQSFTGAGALDTSAFTDSATTPSSQSLTIVANSVIYATGLSANAQNTDYSIGGSSRTPAFNGHNTNVVVEGAWSATGLSGGAQNVTTRADAGSITNYRIAIREASNGGATGNMMMMFS